MFTTRQALENRNYWNDARVRFGERSGLGDFDEKTMTVTVLLEDEDGNEVGGKIPCRYDVCSVCSGKGSHVNPSIDCGGLSAEDFYEDPDFAHDYRSGRYDQRCTNCHGKRVEWVLAPVGEAEKALTRLLDQHWADDASYYATVRAELAMGA